MKEHALLLSTEMVLAYLADRKFVTRRIPGPTNSLVNGKRVSAKGWNSLEFDLPNYMIKDGAFWFFSGSKQEWYKVEPIYQPGDWLWFRETWSLLTYGDHSFYGYAADSGHHEDRKWRPSIHMPKEACRLWAEVTVCNCERIQDITEEQAVKEGSDPAYVEFVGENGKGYWGASFREGFIKLWQSIHGPGSWTTNPPVYAINFNPLSKTGRPDTATLPSDPDAWKRDKEEQGWENH